MGLIGKAWALLHRPRTRFTVEPVLFLFMFATFLSYSTFQQLVHSLVCQHTPNCTLNRTQQQCQQNFSNASWDEQEVQSKTSHWILYINLASGIPAILVSLFYGSLSDHVGRRFFIILPALGSAMNAAIVLVVAYHNTLPIHFFLLGAIVSGLYGGYSVINLAVYSYGSDISNHASRTWQIGILESMTFLGATLSLIVGGVWIKAEGFVPPFWCVVACQLTIIVYTVTFLPESLRSRGDGSSLRTLPSKCFNNLVGFGKLLFGSWKMIVLLITFFVVEINFLGITDTVILYTLGHPLCWSSDLIGYFLALKVFLNGFATLFILPFLVYINVSDTLIIMVGMVAGAAALVIMGVATQSWMMFIVPAVGAMRGCVVPCIRSMLSKLTPADKQGVLFSGVGIVEASCSLLASVIYNSLYPATRHITPGFSFFVMAGTLVIPFTFILVLHLTRYRSRYRSRKVDSPSDERQSLLNHSLGSSID